MFRQAFAFSVVLAFEWGPFAKKSCSTASEHMDFRKVWQWNTSDREYSRARWLTPERSVDVNLVSREVLYSPLDCERVEILTVSGWDADDESGPRLQAKLNWLTYELESGGLKRVAFTIGRR
jgi:hypothetical protein